MCGITGKIYFNNLTVEDDDIRRMNQVISHRGPDDEGVHISRDGRVGMGHVRLSIMDLTTRGHQPMNYLDRYQIVFNGEIYNFIEERQKLEAVGYKFNSNTDTEVILALYDKYGKNCLSHMRGMFAFVIFDEVEQTVFCARDRIGKKPFKYLLKDDVFIFASELKSILTQSDYQREPDYTAIHHFLTLQYCPAPMTGFKDIKKLEAAHYLFINLKTKEVTKERYWDLNYSDKLDYSEKEWKGVLMDKLEESVRLRMISDVPVGAFLSGGVDSSAVVALMSRFSDNPVETFSVGFEEEKYNELKYAKIISQKFRTNHHELIINPQHIELLPEIVKSYEEPYADASALPTYYLNEFTSKNVTVALNGDGGDENFAGYTKYSRYKLSLLLEKFAFLNKYGVNPTLKQLNKIKKSFFLNRSYKYTNSLLKSDKNRYLDLFCAMTDDVKKAYYTEAFQQKINTELLTSDLIAQRAAQANTSDKLERILYADMMTYLPDDLLVKIDIASMRHGLESRSPLLDHELLELSAQIPISLKLKGLNGNKYIFKKTFEDILPDEILHRKKKGFSLPINNWLKGDLSGYMQSHLLTKKFKNRNIITQDSMKKMIHLQKTTSVNYADSIWTVLMLELWFEEYFD